MTILLFIVVLALVVLVHEWGHFYAARRLGIRVDEFGFGFPPRILGRKIGETLYSLNLFPLGGFVRIFGETGEEAGNKESFASKSVWQRAAVIAAGVFMNFVLAWALFSLGAIIGVPAAKDSGLPISNSHVTLTHVAEKSPAADAQLSFGNVVTKVRTGGTSMDLHNADELTSFVRAHRGGVLTLTILPGANASPNAARVITIQSRENPPQGEGPLGIGVADIGIYRVPWWQAPWHGLQNLWLSIEQTGLALVGVFQSAVKQHTVPEGVSGPLGLYTLTGETERLGLSYFIQFIALLSVNLGLLNILPFPALDGGRILFLAIEKIRGKAVHFSYERLAHTLGFFILLALIILISYRDIHRFFL